MTKSFASVLAAFGVLALWTFGQGPRIERDIAYGEVRGRPLELDIYRPQAPGPHPWVLIVHGGAWRSGGRNRHEAPLFARRLAERGIAAASVSYRLAPRDPHPAQIEDCRRALQFLRAHAEAHDLDPKRVGALGLSSGGHLVALLGLQDEAADRNSEDQLLRQSTRVRCVVALAAPLALEPFPDEPVLPLQVRVICQFLGVSQKEEGFEELLLAKARDASPLTYLDRNDPAMLLIHGDADPVVPVSQSRRMAKAAKLVGVSCDLVEISGGGHGDWLVDLVPNGKAAPAWTRRLDSFLERHLEVSRPAAEASTAEPSQAASESGDR